MARRYSRVEIFKKDGNGWATESTHLTEARDVVVRKGIGKVKDTFEFKLLNAHNKYYKTDATITPSEDDRVQVWFWKNSTWDSLSNSQQNAALQIDGVISTVNQTVKGTKDILIKGNGFFDITFKGLVFVRDNTLIYSHTIIQDIIAQLNKFNKNRTITWHPDNDTSSKEIQYTASYKTAVEIIEDLSSDKYTGAGAYKYQIQYDPSAGEDGLYYFIWLKKTTITDQILIEGTDAMYNISLNLDKTNVINAVIYNVGFDCFETPHDFFYFDSSQIVKGGGSWKYHTDTQNVIPDLIKAEYLDDPLLWEQTTDNNRKENFPKDASYPWTFQFETRTDNGTRTGINATAADDDAFNDAIVNESEWVGQESAARLVDMYGEARWSGNITIPQNELYGEGQLLALNSISYGFTSKKIRINEVTQGIYDTVLKLEEDEKSVGID